MEQIKLITVDDIKKVRAISNVINADKEIMPFVYEIQDTVIKEMLGEELYYDLMINYDGEETGNTTPTKYLELLNGKQYEHNGKNYIFNGLKQIIAYYSYYSFIKQWGLHITNAGIVVKSGDMSLPAEDASRGRMLADVKQKLIVFVKDLERFLCRNSETYTLYNLRCNTHVEGGSVTFLASKSRETEEW